MKLAIIGATGMVGQALTAEALQRGHEVTAASRSGKPVEGAPAAVPLALELGDAEAVQSLAAANDAIILATGPSRTGGDHEVWLEENRTALDAVGTTRVLAVGGAGSLLVDGVRLVDTPDFPEAYKAEALTAARFLDLLRSSRDDLDWTMQSPAPVIAPGERTGNVTLGLDSPVGESISTQDFAVVLLDEVEQPKHHRQRFTAAN
ncbi:NAD(P)-dependent oxidoreductase [Psychromicrobium xiongbiense]|uniref:NAD(P)-dependent oxidoreductase n=1 Tax=Psychromicrobium xiongbiense TaxID=3051184 RepID=UPI002552DA2E|nr:NAD(P)H-binding protein [Psychromicrobium sp. YIM S02556]